MGERSLAVARSWSARTLGGGLARWRLRPDALLMLKARVAAAGARKGALGAITVNGVFRLHFCTRLRKPRFARSDLLDELSSLEVELCRPVMYGEHSQGKWGAPSLTTIADRPARLH